MSAHYQWATHRPGWTWAPVGTQVGMGWHSTLWRRSRLRVALGWALLFGLLFALGVVLGWALDEALVPLALCDLTACLGV